MNRIDWIYIKDKTPSKGEVVIILFSALFGKSQKMIGKYLGEDNLFQTKQGIKAADFWMVA